MTAATRTVTPTNTPTATPTLAPFGVQLWALRDSTVRRQVIDAGIPWIRREVSWAAIEPSPGQYNWTSTDADLLLIAQSGFTPILTIMQNPAWATEQPNSYRCGPFDTEDLDRFAEFVRRLVERYDGDGIDDFVDPQSGLRPTVKYWEFYNEPDETRTDQPIACWGNYPQRYAQMLTYAYPALKQANPDAQLIFGSPAHEQFSGATFNMQFVDQVLSTLNTMPGPFWPYFDLMGFHQYDAFRDRWDGALPYNQGIAGKARHFRDLMASYGITKPLINTEVGLAAAFPDTVPLSQRLEWQARHLIHVFVRGMAANLVTAIWYNMRDAHPGMYGLLDSSGQPRPAYYAFQQLIQELNNYAFETQLGPPETGDNRIQAYRFSHPNGTPKLVVWTDDGQPIKRAANVQLPMTFTSSTLGGAWSGNLRVVDKFGNPGCGTTTIISDGDPCDQDNTPGSITIYVSQDPLFISPAP